MKRTGVIQGIQRSESVDTCTLAPGEGGVVTGLSPHRLTEGLATRRYLKELSCNFLYASVPCSSSLNLM